jgi:anti-sigma regulatory factor (Ser/Thr protein kinase)
VVTNAENVVTGNLRGPAPASLDLRLRSGAAFSPVLRERLHIWLEESGATKTEAFEVVLATVEAFANAVEHPQEPTDHFVAVTGAIDDHTVTISIRDSGTWNSDQTRKEDGGLGLVIMEALMDGVQVECSASGSTVTMRKYLEAH